MADPLNPSRYRYIVHDPEEGLEAFAFRGPVRPARKLPRKRIPHRSLSLPSIQDQTPFFMELKATPISATAQWVDSLLETEP